MFCLIFREDLPEIHVTCDAWGEFFYIHDTHSFEYKVMNILKVSLLGFFNSLMDN